MKKNEALKKIEKLKKLLNKWSKSYYLNDNSLVDDSVYDFTLAELFALEKKFPEFITNDSPTQTVGANLEKYESSTFEKTKHKIPMLSLGNAFNTNDLLDFNKKIEKDFKKFDYFVEPKIDGLSISLIYKNGFLKKAITRGDGIIGEDVTINAKQIKNIPKEIKYKKDITIRGEIYMSNESFLQNNKIRIKNNETPLSNPRNAASGTMRQINSNIVASRNLDMIAYWAMQNETQYAFKTQEETINNLKNMGFKTSEISFYCKNISEVIKKIDFISKKRIEIDYEIDGIVIKVNNSDLYEKIGYTSKFPKWAIAYKFPAEVKETKLIDIFPTVGRTGRITYNALLEPVDIAGTVVQRATLHNADYINDLDLRINDYVNIKKAGEIIPKVISANKSKRIGNELKWSEAINCPSCGEKLVKKTGEVDQYCKNDFCKSRILEKIIHFSSRDAMNIEGLSTKQIEKFIDLKWIKSFSDIYLLNEKREELLTMEGYQEKSVNSLLESIEKSKNTSLDRFIFSLGIRHIGKKTSKDLANKYGSIENISNIDIDNLLSTNDLGIVKSNSIINYFKNEININEIKSLINLGVKISNDKLNVDENSFLFNKNVVVTGTINNLNRQEVKKYLESMGAKVKSSISNLTDYLIIGDKPSNAKIQKIDKNKIINFKDIKKL